MAESFQDYENNPSIIASFFQLMSNQLQWQNKIIMKFIEVIAPAALQGIEEENNSGMGQVAEILKMVGLSNQLANTPTKKKPDPSGSQGMKINSEE